MVKLAHTIILLGVFSTFVYAQVPDMLSGTFSNGVLTLTLSSAGGRYSGTASTQGKNYPVVLELSAGSVVQGYYSDQGQQYPMYGTIGNGGLSLVIDGLEFQLVRQETAVTTSSNNRPTQSPAAIAPNPAGKPLAVSGNEVGDKYLGFKFRPPAGWIAQKTDGGYLLGSNTEKGFIVVIPHEYTTLEQVKTAAYEGMADENGTVLQVTGDMQAYGKNGLVADFGGSVQWKPATGRAVGMLSPYGGGITIMTAVEKQSYSPAYAGYVEQIANSVVFSRPEIPPVADEWKQNLTNCRLTYMWSYSSSGYGDGSYAGGSQQTTIDLCGRGFFNYSDNNSMSVDAGSGTSGYGGGQSQGSGTWKVVGRGNQAVLVLTFHDGQVYEYRLSMQEGKTYLDDKRYFRTYSNDSSAEHRPQCW
ncbi:hypothetical protein JW935_01040 [candidate division KSB1 bacterium]|nr:hypothetical protein [candidate division KSB1 bacterium]